MRFRLHIFLALMLAACAALVSDTEGKTRSDGGTGGNGAGGSTASAGGTAAGVVAGGGIGTTGGGSAKGGGGAGATGGGTAGASGVVKSPGCGKLNPPLGDLDRTVTVAGKKRTFTIHVKGPYSPDTPRALAIGFHGAGGDRFSLVAGRVVTEAAGAATQVIAVDPQGIEFIDKQGNSAGVGWNQYCDGYDMPFFDEMIRIVESEYCVDSNRRFVLGFSWGGDMVNALSCCRGDKIKGAAPSSGDEVDYNSTCTTTARPAFYLSYWTQDAYTPEQFTASVNAYRTAHGCSTQSDAISPSPCVAYRNCKKSVVECKYAGTNHVEPQGWHGKVWSWFNALP